MNNLLMTSQLLQSLNLKFRPYSIVLIILTQLFCSFSSIPRQVTGYKAFKKHILNRFTWRYKYFQYELHDKHEKPMSGHARTGYRYKVPCFFVFLPFWTSQVNIYISVTHPPFDIHFNKSFNGKYDTILTTGVDCVNMCFIQTSYVIRIMNRTCKTDSVFE